MPNPDRQSKSKTNRTEQDIANSGFDETYQVPLSMPLVENGGALYRLQADASGNLKVNVAVSAAAGGAGDASAATGAGINATGTAKLTVYPGLTAAANSIATDVLPQNIRIVSTVATAASTYSIGYSIIP